MDRYNEHKQCLFIFGFIFHNCHLFIPTSPIFTPPPVTTTCFYHHHLIYSSTTWTHIMSPRLNDYLQLCHVYGTDYKMMDIYNVGFYRENRHMEIWPLLSEYMLLIFIVKCLYACISPRFFDKYNKEIGYFVNLHDSITDFEIGFPELASSSWALNKLLKAVHTSKPMKV